MTMILGTWRMTFTWTVDGQDYSADYPGRRDDDDPYYEVVGTHGYLTSRRTGERWELWTYTASTITNVRRLFIPNAPPQIKYDCINGVCLPSTDYGTPGFYLDLASCQAACGQSSCPDGYECVETASTEKLRKCICG